MTNNSPKAIGERVRAALKLAALPTASVIVALKIVAVAAVAILASAGACGDGTDDYPVGFTIAITKPVPALVPGTNGTATLILTRHAGFTEAVRIFTSVTQAVLTASSDFEIGPGETTHNVTLSVPAGTTQQEVMLKVSAQASGYATANDNALVSILPAGNINLLPVLDPEFAFIGTTHHVLFSIVRSQYTQTVTTTAGAITPTPASPFTVTINPEITTNGSVDNPLVVDVIVPANTAPGTYNLPITATGPGGVSSSRILKIHAIKPSYSLTVTLPTGGIQAGATGQATIVADRNPGFIEAISLTGTGPNGIAIAPASIGSAATQATMQVTVPGSVAPGSYVLTFNSSAPGQADVARLVTLQVVAGSYALSATSASLSMSLNSTQPNNVSINRVGFVGGVTISATTDDPANIVVTANPPTATTGNAVTLSVAAANGAAVSPAAHTVTVKGASTLPDVTTTFALVLTHPNDGTQTPVGIVLVPTTGQVAVGATIQYKAYLVDAQNNRVSLPANNSISIVTTNSGIANRTATAYDAVQRWQTATIQGFSSGTTQVTAYYVVNGSPTINAIGSVTVP